MTALELMEEILADTNTGRRNRRIAAWYAADRAAASESGSRQPYPVIANALEVASEDLAGRWYEATADAMGGPPAEDPEPAGSPGHGQAAGAKPAGAKAGS